MNSLSSRLKIHACSSCLQAKERDSLLGLLPTKRSMRWEICGSSSTWSRCWSCCSLQSWFTSPPSSSSLSYSSSSFPSLVLPSRERDNVWGKWGESEWSWGSGVGKYLQFVLTCGAMPLNGWQLISYSICSLCTIIGWPEKHGRLSDRLWFRLSKLKNLISLTLSPCWGL